MPRLWSSFAEHQFNLLERLASCLGISEKSLDGGANTEDAEDDEELPGDVLEAGRNEESNGEVEKP